MAAFSPAECTTTEKVIGGFRIPKHTSVVVDVRRLNTDCSIWGRDSDEFRPERFAGMSVMQWRYGMVRWGLGVGKCLGKNMADTMLKMVTIRVVELYVLKTCERGEVKQGGATIAASGEVEFLKL